MRKSEGRPAPRQPVTAPSDATSPAPLESLRRAREQRARVGLNLFWRTFFLLALLLVGSILGLAANAARAGV
jgi:two-component system osmolarity sensor histidine kinase EnvZ